MASNETILAWKAELLGAESVKDGLRKINEEVKKGSLTQGEANKVIQIATKDTRNYKAEQNLLTRSFQSSHPQLAMLSRSMSTFSHIARTGMNIVNSLSLMWIRNGQNAQTSAELSYNASIAERLYLDAVRKFGPDSREAREALEKWNLEKGKAIQFKTDTFQQGFADIGTYIFVATSAIADFFVALKLIPALGPQIAAFATSMGGPFVMIGAAALAAGYIISEWAANSSEEFRLWRENNGRILEEFFTISIPTALGTAALFLTQFFINDLPKWAGIGLDFLKTLFVNTWNAIIATTNFGVNSVISGVNSIINGAISAINAFISAINNILKKAKLGTISLIPKFTGIPPINIPMIAAAKGFNGMVNSPTMFLAGEAGPEQVSISPNGRGGYGGISVVVNVQGSILTERELFRRVDENLKNELKKRNFRILQ